MLTFSIIVFVIGYLAAGLFGVSSYKEFNPSTLKLRVKILLLWPFYLLYVFYDFVKDMILED